MDIFPTLIQTFQAAKAHSNLSTELFLKQVRRHISEGPLLASGIRFWEEVRYCPSGADGTEKTKYISRASETQRSDIPPRDMVEYWPIFERGPGLRMIGLIESQLTQDRWSLCALIEARGDTLQLESRPARPFELGKKRDGWADVRLLASEVERLWPQKKTVAQPPSDLEIDAAILAKQKQLGRQPTDRNAIAAVNEKHPTAPRSRIRERWAALYPNRKQGPRA